MKERPFVAFVCCWMAGAAVPSLWPGPGLFLALGACLLILLGAWIAGMLTGRAAALCAAALLLALAERTGVERANQSDLRVIWQRNGPPQQAEVSGFISSPPMVDGDAVTFRLQAGSLKQGLSLPETRLRETVLVRVKLQVRGEQAAAGQWKRGDAVRVEGTPELPGDAGNFGAFDYRKYLQREGVHWQWSVRGAGAVRLSEQAVPLRMLPLRLIDELRSRIAGLTERLYPDGDAGYMKGLVAGISEEVDPAQYDAFSRLGLTHVLAISGLHVGVVVFVLLRLGALFRLTRERAIDIAFAAMPAYMLLTGASPSAVRACVMAMIGLALARRHRLKDGLHLLAAAALIMVVWDPLVVENVSFQLSFAVTAGLLLFTGTVAGLLSAVRVKLLRDALAIGLTAQAVSFPLTVYYFHSFHLLSLPVNLLLVPFISFAVMPLGMASVALGGLWYPLGIIPAKLASYGNRLTFDLVEWLNGAQTLRTIWPQPSKLWVAAAYVGLGATLWLLRRWNIRRENEERREGEVEDTTAPLGLSMPSARGWSWRAMAGGLAIALLWGSWFVWGYRPAFLNHQAEVQFLDVGQGDGILIRTGTGKHLLVDTGGTVRFRKPGDEWRERRNPYEIGRMLIVPLLRQRGVRELDALVLTHLDADHIGGAEAVLRDIPVRAIIWNGTWKTGEEPMRLFTLAQKKGIPVYAARTGMQWDIDGSTSLHILYPDATALDPPQLLPVVAKQNQSCIVLLLSLYGRRFLLTGDVETPGETAILSRLAGIAPPVDVMKAAHHGSRTSTSEPWLAGWQPSEVVISVGARNLYGHPHPAVVTRIESFGSVLFRTDRDGEIEYRIRPGGGMQRRQKRGRGPAGGTSSDTSSERAVRQAPYLLD